MRSAEERRSDGQEARDTSEEIAETAIVRFGKASKKILGDGRRDLFESWKQDPSAPGKANLSDASVRGDGPSLDEALAFQLCDNTRHAAAVEIHPP